MITEEHRRLLDSLLVKCLEHDDLLSEWEQQFVSDFTEKLEKHGEALVVSAKQQGIFDRLEEKLAKAGF